MVQTWRPPETCLYIKGNECQYFHPKLCRNSVLKRECFKRDCILQHLKHTRKHQGAANERNAAGNRPPANKTDRPRQKIRFNSLSTLGGGATPYAPTIQKRNRLEEREPDIPSSWEADHQSNSFLVKLMESMKEGLILQMSEKLLEFQTSIPEMVREELMMNRPKAPYAPTFQPPPNQQQMSFAQTAPHHLPAGILPVGTRNQYPGYCY